MPASYEGGCACGAIRYTVSEEPLVSYCCHCTECQKRTASAFGLNLQVPAGTLTIDRGTPRERHRRADSGNEMTILFCGDCGTSLLSLSTARPNIRVVYAGTLDDPGRVPVKLNIWTKSALPWVRLDPAIEQVEGQPRMADYYDRPVE